MEAATVLKRSREGILAQWDELWRLRGVVLKTADLDAIHDLRVTSRRFRAAIGLFEPWLPPKSAARLKKSTRKLTRVLGGLRNIDEALLFFREHASADPEGGVHMCTLLARLRPGELARITAALSSFDHHLDHTVRKAVERLTKHRTAHCGDTSLPDYFSDTGQRLFQPIQRLLPAATSPTRRKSRHALRIAIKKWRYFFETIAPVLERDYSSILALLKEYQTILGSMNDIVEFGVLCNSLKLSRSELRAAKTALRTEDKLLLRKLAELIEQKPLSFVPL